MQSIATITTAPERTALTTLERVKLELSIATDEYDALLSAKIAEATSDIEAHLCRTLARATLTETFWSNESGWTCASVLVLGRAPVASITSVTEDGVTVDSDEYRLDAGAGLLYRLDADGYPSSWEFTKSIIVVFAAGYELPGASSPDLPAALEAAAIALVNSYWQSRGRDPLVKAEDIPGLGSVQYWVGSVGEAGSLPPDVESKIAPFRRIILR